MKHARKLASLLLALVMVFALAATAFAAGATTPTGSIKITSNEKVSVAGRTFNAYRLLDVKAYGSVTNEDDITTNTAVYTVPEALKEFYQNRYSLRGDEGNFDALVAERIAAESDLFAFAKAALDAAKTANITPSTATADENATFVTISGLPLGYYVVEDTATQKPVSALILDTTTPNVETAIKADKPTVDKKIDGVNDTDPGTTGDVKYNNASVGDKIPYKVTSQVPDMTGYTKYYFVLNDKLSKGLTFDNNVAITIGDKTLADTDFTVNHVVNEDKTTSVEIVFKNFIQYKTEEYKNAGITVTYSATVNKDAEIGVTGNPNEVKLIYSNNPNVTDDGSPDNTDKPDEQSPVGETPVSKTYTYVTELELIKVDNNGNRLTGAEFQIAGTRLNTVLVSANTFTVSENGEYWKLKDGTYTTDDPNAEGMDQSKYESTAIKYAKTTTTNTITKTDTVTYTGTVGADGVLRFTGLAAGDYTITELKAPAGYNLLETPIKVTIGFTAPAEGAASQDCTWTYTGTDIVNGTNVNKITIENQAGTELPSTGGMGTTIFYVLGSILVVGAVVLLVTKKRMSSAER